MRRRGYLVTSMQTFTLPGLTGPATAARWYRVTYERIAHGGAGHQDAAA
jgi:hypothetical protein